MYVIGIDWSDEKHDACVLDDSGNIYSEFVFDNTVDGFEKFRKRIKRLNGSVRFNIERSDGLLVNWLVRNQFEVYITPPLTVHHRRPRRSKDDRSDAHLLAYLLHVKDPETRPLAQRSDLVEKLRQMLRAYDAMVREQRRFGNRLTYLLKQYYPAALKAFCQPHRLIALAFLERYPTPESAREATIDDLRQFLCEEKYRGKKLEIKVYELYQVLQAPELVACVQDGLVMYVQMLLPILKQIYRNRVELEKQIIHEFQGHPDAIWWQQFPGAKRLTAARLLAWIGDDRNRFPTANSLQATAGTVPVTRRSGKSHMVEFRTACSHKLRKAADDLARQSVKSCRWAQEYYDSQRNRGHTATRAYRALGNKWLKIIWTLWQRGASYDEDIHMANRLKSQPQAEMQRAG